VSQDEASAHYESQGLTLDLEVESKGIQHLLRFKLQSENASACR